MKNLVLTVILVFVFANSNAQWYNNYNTGNDMKSVSFSDSYTGWAVGANNTIVKTTNSGNNWFSQNCGLPFTTNFNSVYFYDNQNGLIVGDPNSGSATIIKTTNGGNNWQQLTVSAPDYVLTDVIFTPIDRYALVCGYNSGSNQSVILKSTNEGANWITSYNNTGRINRLLMPNQVFGFACGDILLKTDDKGNSWVTVSSINNINDVYFLSNKKDGWICTESGKIYVTTDTGSSWNEQLQNNNQPINSLYFTNQNTGWASTADGQIFKTTNGGEHWTRQITGLNTSLNCVVMNSNSVGFAVGSNGAILRTINGGGAISSDYIEYRHSRLNNPILPNQTTSDTINIPPIPFEEYMTVVDVTVFIDTVLTTQDGNLVFMLYHNGVTDTVIYKVGGTGHNFLGTILNDGADHPIESGTAPFRGDYKPSRPLCRFNNIPLSGDWILNIYQEGPGGEPNKLLTGVIKSWGMGVTSNSVLPEVTGNGNIYNPVPGKYKLYQNYPNPFNPVTKIKFDITENSFVNVTIYDITGRAVTNLINKNLSNGSYEIPWNAANYSSGVYFYRLSAGSFTDTKKMILIK